MGAASKEAVPDAAKYAVRCLPSWLPDRVGGWDGGVQKQTQVFFAGDINGLCSPNTTKALHKCANTTNDRGLLYARFYEPPIMFEETEGSRERELFAELPSDKRALRKDLPALFTKENVRIFRGAISKYQENLTSSIFCLGAEGKFAGYGARLMQAVIAGCIPIIIKPRGGQTLIWEEYLPWKKFAVVVNETELDSLPEQLASYSAEEIRSMRRELGCALPRFFWSSIYGSYIGESLEQDAFATLLEVLLRRQNGKTAPESSACSEETAAFSDWIRQPVRGDPIDPPNHLPTSGAYCRFPVTSDANSTDALCLPPTPHAADALPWLGGGAACYGKASAPC
ncbi:hypothetical protein CYMTET_15845 [Cymbomonas tetramitiformis]|uniref:Exostosin GT47 domain-containing protein n=1 Tax=Cymbomonas tetramitiformis TaxID=36881 RepID=A0AAE0GDQ9_9CHLO|nr:hypothetical protein CYMTET_15845 [Cymbomonas tetramitiformis]